MTEKTEGYLLDTNHCAYILNAKGKPKNKQSQLEKNTIQTVSSKIEVVLHHISEATLGELLYGAEYSKHFEPTCKNLKHLLKLFHLF